MAGERPTWQAYFAAELRHWRELRGMTQKRLAEAVAFSESLVASVETCQRKPKPDFVRRCDEALEAGGSLLRLLEELVERELVPDFLDRWRRIESEATALSWFEPLVLPGLVQTAEYAYEVFRSNGQPGSLDIDAQVRTRLERQEVLRSDAPPMLVSVIDESVLHRPIGGPKVMHDQLMRLVELAGSPDVVLQVIPRDAGAHPGLAGPFVIATVDGEEVVYLDNALCGHVVENAKDVSLVKRMWESLRAEALPRTASLDLVKEAARRWTT